MSAKRNFNRSILYFAALVSAFTAGVYFLIGFNIVSVLDIYADQSFGLAAGVAYTLGAVLLLIFDRRIVWILGAILQIFVIYTYFNFAPQRIPAFEAWGITLRVTQVLIFMALVYLIGVRTAPPMASTAKIIHE